MPVPGSIENAAPSTVLPLSLSKAYGHSREYKGRENNYPDGTNQRSLQVATSRKSWRIEKRLTATLLEELRDFWLARKGSFEPFYFYDPWDAEFAYDPTGVSSTGRYTVRFEGEWSQTIGIARSDTGFQLIELA